MVSNVVAFWSWSILISAFHVASQIPDHVEIAIVGGGAVGLSMAVHLARSGKTVLVLEAGRENALETPQAGFADVETVGHAFSGLRDGRLLGLGGTTNLWGGQLVRFDPIVFENRPWLPESGWPIEESDLTSSYELALDLFGMGKRLDDAEVWKRIGVTPPQCGSDLELFFTRWTPEPNFTRLFACDLHGNSNLTVLTEAPVTGLCLDEAGRMVGLVVTAPDGERHGIKADKVVLAQGTVEIARLLKMPVAGKGPAPWSDNEWLGRGFADHIDADAGKVCLLDKRRFYRLFDAALLDGLKYLPKLKLTEAAQRQGRHLGIAGHFVFESVAGGHLSAFKAMAQSVLQGRPDVSGFLAPGKALGMARAAVPAMMHYLLRRRVYNPGDRGITFRMTGEQVAVPESGIRLTRQRDALDMPTIALDWRIDGVELDTMARFAREANAFLEREGLARIAIDPLLLDRDPCFIAKIEDGYHHMGMARMGTSPADGVVDRDLKVFGTNNLFVAGAAVFRSTGFANPTLTAITLGLRLAAGLAEGRL